MKMETIKEGDNATTVAGKTLNNALFAKELTATGALLSVIIVLVMICFFLLDAYVDKIEELTREVKESNSIMIRNQQILQGINLYLQKSVDRSADNARILEKNHAALNFLIDLTKQKGE